MEETKTDMVPGPTEIINYFLTFISLLLNSEENSISIYPPGRETRMMANSSDQEEKFAKRAPEAEPLVLPGTAMRAR